MAAPKGCEAEAKRFYGEVLGFTEIPKPESLRARGGVWFQCGVHELHVGVEAEFTPAKKAHPAFAVQGLAALRQRLIDQGIVVQDDTSLPGVERFYVSDPFGNRVEFLERV